MKTTWLILIAALFIPNGILHGQDLFLSFSGSGVSTSVDSVKVENLSRGEKLMVGGSQILHLEQIVTETSKLTDLKSGITFSPNPMNEYSIMEFSIPVTGKTTISIIDLGGKEILKINDNLPRGNHSYRVSGIKTGIHFVRVSSGGYTLTGTLVSISSQGNARAEYINTITVSHPGKDIEALNQAEPVKRANLAEISMRFRDGDSLKFTAASGNYRTIIIDVPDTSKTMTFDFYECIDGDRNNYPVIKIGNHIWMAENLKTTSFNDGTPIKNEKNDSIWATLDDKGTPAFSWYNNNEEYKNIYGGLYNNPAVSKATGKNVCPAGWHVAAGEWDELFSWLDNTASTDSLVSEFAGNLIKESGNMHWDCPGNRATNETGFTALPGGLRRPYFAHLGQRGYFWDGSYGKFILYCSNGVVGHVSSRNDYGLSVRCVRDKEFNISFAGSGASTTVSLIKAENLSTGVSVTINEDQNLYLGHGTPPAGAIHMEYLEGQNLKYTGFSGDYSTVVVDKPAGDKTITFNFIPCTDADNNNYPVVKIGEYSWMAENLKTTKYKDGTPVPYQTLNADSPDSLIFSWEGYSWYNNDPGYKDTYGALYKMNTFKSGKLCPAGWHAPNNAEWEYLTDILGGPSEAGGRLKETGTVHWAAPNTGATNEIGFTALPGGELDHYIFSGLGKSATFWSTSKCGGSSDCGWSISFSEKSISWNDLYEEVGYTVRCVYGAEPMIPEVETWFLIPYVTTTETYIGLYIKNDHGLPVTQKGVCWSTTPLPTINDPHTSNGLGLITGLTPATKYYARAYATNSAGTGYSMSVSFTTKAIGVEDEKADIEGNIYEVIRIGSQVWMKENLRSTVLNDATPMELITDDNLAWWNSVTPAYCFHPRGEIGWQGAIYNWQSVNSGRLCPSGWHVPSDTDWSVLTNYMIANDYNFDGTHEGNKIAKALAMHFVWKSSDLPGTPGNTDYPEKIDASGFSARPAGTRGSEFSPQIHEVAVLWSSTPSHSTGNYYVISYSGVSGILTGPDSGDKQAGWAVRCLKD